MNVAILGASDNPERYSYKALRMLQKHQHQVYLVSPKLKSFEDIPVFSNLNLLHKEKIPIHTLTLYVNSTISETMKDQIKNLAPKRIIFNPGTESESLRAYLKESGIECLDACTLVLLSTNQF